jgi:hypothetical protein
MADKQLISATTAVLSARAAWSLAKKKKIPKPFDAERPEGLNRADRKMPRRAEAA